MIWSKRRGQRIPCTPDCVLQRNGRVKPVEIEDLRQTVGWERCEHTYAQVLRRNFTHYTLRRNEQLAGFLSVISDGISDALLVDVVITPALQDQGLGRAMVQTAIRDLRADGIRCIQVVFEPHLEPFYRKCGFHILKAGIIDDSD